MGWEGREGMARISSPRSLVGYMCRRRTVPWTRFFAKGRGVSGVLVGKGGGDTDGGEVTRVRWELTG